MGFWSIWNDYLINHQPSPGFHYQFHPIFFRLLVENSHCSEAPHFSTQMIPNTQSAAAAAIFSTAAPIRVGVSRLHRHGFWSEDPRASEGQCLFVQDWGAIYVCIDNSIIYIYILLLLLISVLLLLFIYMICIDYRDLNHIILRIEEIQPLYPYMFIVLSREIATTTLGDWRFWGWDRLAVANSEVWFGRKKWHHLQVYVVRNKKWSTSKWLWN